MSEYWTGSAGPPLGFGMLPEKPHLDYGRVGYLGDYTNADAGVRLAIAYTHHVEVYSFEDTSMMNGKLAGSRTRKKV